LSTPDKGDPRRPEARRDLPMINERIRDRELRVIDEDGSQLGIVSRLEALQIAKDKGLDLLLVQPDANPPVARILDYGRHKFEQDKRDRENKKKQHRVDVKEIKMRYKIEDHDYQVKVRSGQKFLHDGDMIKVLILLRGREMQHKDLAISLMHRFANELKDLGLVDREPKIEGKSVIMILSPIPQKGKPAPIVDRPDPQKPL
jgi:translation initiation factor IF-3